MCEQRFHGFVGCALGWACYKTYVSRPEGHSFRIHSISILGNGLGDLEVGRYEDAVRVYEADLAYTTRYEGANIQALLATRDCLAGCLSHLDREEEALALQREIFAETKEHFGIEHMETLEAAHSLAFELVESGHCVECTQFFFEFRILDLAMRIFGAEHDVTLTLRTLQGRALSEDENASLDNLRQAVDILEDVGPILSRVLGPRHPDTLSNEEALGEAREKLARAEAPVARRTRSSKAEES